MSNIAITGTSVVSTSPEGKTTTIPVSKFMELCRNKHAAPSVLPDGTKAVIINNTTMVLVHQTPPEVRSLKWIAADSPRSYGPGTKYRTVQLALPYVITMAQFYYEPSVGGMTLSKMNECFYRTEPIKSLDDELFYPSLLNCSKFNDDSNDARPKAWICTQHLDFDSIQAEPDYNRRIQRSMDALVRCLFESGFNRSSEEHEGSSWFTESNGIDKRLATVEAWEAASVKNPLFVLEVPWISTQMTVKDMAARMVRIGLMEKSTSITNAKELSRLIVNSKG